MRGSGDGLNGAVRWHSDFDAATRCESGEFAQGPAHRSCLKAHVRWPVVQIVVNRLLNGGAAVLRQLRTALQDGRQGALVNPAKFVK